MDRLSSEVKLVGDLSVAEFKKVIGEFHGETQEGMDPGIKGDEEVVAWALSSCIATRLDLEHELGKLMISPAERLDRALKLIVLERKERWMKEWLERFA